MPYLDVQSSVTIASKATSTAADGISTFIDSDGDIAEMSGRKQLVVQSHFASEFTAAEAKEDVEPNEKPLTNTALVIFLFAVLGMRMSSWLVKDLVNMFLQRVKNWYLMFANDKRTRPWRSWKREKMVQAWTKVCLIAGWHSMKRYEWNQDKPNGDGPMKFYGPLQFQHRCEVMYYSMSLLRYGEKSTSS